MIQRCRGCKKPKFFIPVPGKKAQMYKKNWTESMLCRKSRPLLKTKVRYRLLVTGEAPVTPASPVVKIIPPEGFPYFSETQLEIRYSVDTPPDNPVKEVKVTVNGEIQPTARVVKKGRSVTVTLPKDDSSISISARNNTGWSETEFLRLKWDKSLRAGYRNQ